MRFINGENFKSGIVEHKSAKSAPKKIRTTTNVINPTTRLSGRKVSYSDEYKLDDKATEYYLIGFKSFLTSYSELLIDAIDMGLITESELPNFHPTTLSEGKAAHAAMKELIASIPYRIIQLLNKDIDAMKSELINSGVPSEIIAEFDSEKPMDFDLTISNGGLILNTPFVDSAIVVDVHNFRSNSKAAGSLISLLCKGRLYETAYNAGYYNVLEVGSPIEDKKILKKINSVLNSRIDTTEKEGKLSWFKLAMPVCEQLENKCNIEFAEYLYMLVEDLDIKRMFAFDKNYITEMLEENSSEDCKLDDFINHAKYVLQTVMSFSYLREKLTDEGSFSKLIQMKSPSGQILNAIHKVAVKAFDNECLEVSNDEGLGVPTFILPEYLNNKNQIAYENIDQIYNYAMEVDELNTSYEVKVIDSQLIAVKNTLINSYCTQLLAFISQRPSILLNN